MSRKGGSLGDAVRTYMEERGIEGRVAQASVVHEWEELVGRQLANVSRPEFVDASETLWVRVKSAAWMQELQLMSPAIIRDLARKGKRFRRIRWLTGSLNTTTQLRAPARRGIKPKEGS